MVMPAHRELTVLRCYQPNTQTIAKGELSIPSISSIPPSLPVATYSQYILPGLLFTPGQVSIIIPSLLTVSVLWNVLSCVLSLTPYSLLTLPDGIYFLYCQALTGFYYSMPLRAVTLLGLVYMYFTLNYISIITASYFTVLVK